MLLLLLFSFVQSTNEDYARATKLYTDVILAPLSIRWFKKRIRDEQLKMQLEQKGKIV